jgi:site-specific DNA recombinase
MRAAIYARFSTELQQEASIDDQVRNARALIEGRGWQVGEIYADRARSGATTLRSGYQKMLTDSRRNAFDVVVCEGLDRLSRDQETIAGLYKTLQFQGIAIVTCAEGEVSEIHVGLKGTMNALFLKDLALKTHRGLEGRVRKGRSGGGRAYGYDVKRVLKDDGEADRGLRTINEDEAAIVRRIFRDFAGGHSPKAIARALNVEGVPGPNGKAWRDTTIRGHATRRTGILRNDLYQGLIVWNRQRYVRDPRTGNRVSRANPETLWIRQDVPELRIVDPDLWNKVQVRLEGVRQSPLSVNIRKHAFWEQRRPRHLLTGIAFCHACGGPLASVGRDYLACRSARLEAGCSVKQSIRREKLEAAILSGLKDRLMTPDLVAEFVGAFHQEMNRIEGDRGAIDAEVRRALTKIDQKIEGLYDAIADGLRTEGLKARLVAMEEERATLKAKLDAAPVARPLFHPNLGEAYRHKVDALHTSLNDDEARPQAIEILRSLIERVDVRWEDGEPVADLSGDILKLIALPSKESALDDDIGRSVKVVAGVGFEPTTFRL